MRCYNGSPDKELQEYLNSEKSAHERLNLAGYHAAYFPMEGKYMVFDEKYKSNFKFYDTVMLAANDILNQN